MAAKILELTDRIASLTLVPSGGGAFEVTANGKLLHSKLATHEWPDFDAVDSSFSFRESEGCLVALAIFKIAVDPQGPR